jgi:hypothetical protein
MADNKDTLPKGAKAEDLKSSISPQILQQKQQQKIQAWILDLKKQAKITYTNIY